MSVLAEREFHIGDILSVSTGYFASPNGFGAVHELIEYLLGEPVMTHELPGVWERCKRGLIAQHPQLADADCTGITPQNHAARLAALVAEYGESLPVAPIVAGSAP
jgi:hypothetical protein